MNIVTFETAKRLKAAGFPEPAFETGQFWYNDFAAATFIGRKTILENFQEGPMFFCHSVLTARTQEMLPSTGDGTYFAPNLEDILREIPPITITIIGDGSWRLSNDLGLSFEDYSDKSLSECAGLFYLKINGQEK